MHHNVLANCEQNVRVCALVTMNSTTGEIIHDFCPYSRKVTYRMVLINFVTSYLITVFHLVIFGTMIIVKVYFVSSRNEGVGGYSRAEHYQRVVTVRIMTLIATFVLCWSPFWVMTLLNEMDDWNPVTVFGIQIYTPIHMCAKYIGYTNSTINPMIYAAMTEDFRASFRVFLFRIKEMFRPGNIPIFIRSIIVPSRQERTDEPQTQTVQLLTADGSNSLRENSRSSNNQPA